MKQKNASRRKFLSIAGRGAIAIPVMTTAMGRSIANAEPARPRKALYSPVEPVAPSGSLILNVRDYGATGDGKTKDTAALQLTIDRCAVLGGGKVVVPAGNYLTGSITLRSNIILSLEKNAVITGSADMSDYPVTQVRWEGKWIQGHIGLIYGIDLENAAVIGEGSIIGADALGGRPNKQNPLRHPALIEFIQCRHIQLEGFSTHYRHMWSVHPTYCEDVLIRNLRIRSTGGNGDGIDVDSCRHVHIDRCDISTGDDCISLKSGRGSEGNDIHRPTEDVLITGCTFADSNFACIGIGSETSGGIRNVRIEHCKCTHARSFAVYIKSRIGRGAFIENISVDHFDAANMDGGFLRINLMSSGLHDEYPIPGLAGVPAAANFRFANIRVQQCPTLVDATRISAWKPLQGFVFEDVSGDCERGIFLANVQNAMLRNIHVKGYSGSLVNVHNVTGSGIKDAQQIPGQTKPPLAPPDHPVYKLH